MEQFLPRGSSSPELRLERRGIVVADGVREPIQRRLVVGQNVKEWRPIHEKDIRHMIGSLPATRV